jgi:hypothetical protein
MSETRTDYTTRMAEYYKNVTKKKRKAASEKRQRVKQEQKEAFELEALRSEIAQAAEEQREATGAAATLLAKEKAEAREMSKSMLAIEFDWMTPGVIPEEEILEDGTGYFAYVFQEAIAYINYVKGSLLGGHYTHGALLAALSQDPAGRAILKWSNQPIVNREISIRLSDFRQSVEASEEEQASFESLKEKFDAQFDNLSCELSPQAGITKTIAHAKGESNE